MIFWLAIKNFLKNRFSPKKALLYTLIIQTTFLFSVAEYIQPEDILLYPNRQRVVSIVSNGSKTFLTSPFSINVFDVHRKKWTDSYPSDEEIQKTIWNSKLGRLEVLRNGQAYELNLFSRAFHSIDSIATDPVSAQSFGKNIPANSIFLSDGYYNTGSWVRNPAMKQSAIIKSILVPKDQVWIITRELGAFFGSYRHRRASPIFSGLPSGEAHKIFEWNNELLFGLDNPRGSFFALEKKSLKFKEHFGGLKYDFPSARIYDIKYWKKFLWLGTDQGLIRMNPKNSDFKRYGFFSGIHADAVLHLNVFQNELYMGTNKGLVYLKSPNLSPKMHSHPKRPLMKIYDTSPKGDTLWIAAQEGIFGLHKKQWISPGDLKFERGQRIKLVEALPQGVIYSKNGQLFKYEKSETFRYLANISAVQDLQYHPPWLIASHIDGIYFWHEKEGESIHFNFNDGIPGSEIQAFHWDKQRQLWMVTDKGLARLNTKPYLP